MFKKSLILLLLISFSCSKKDVFDAEKQTIINPIAKCENGFAGEYPCNDYDLLTYFTLEELNGAGTTGSSCWGWVDPDTEKEYALMCTNKGVTFIDITNPSEAIIIGSLKSKTENNPIREVRIFKSLAYIISEATDHGLQIFNLTKLEETVNPPVEFESDADFSRFGAAQSVTINKESGFAYVMGSNTFNGGPHFIDINRAFKAPASGGYETDSYTNDTQVVTYKGADTDYTDKEILIGSNENEIVLLNVTDKANPIKIATINYSDISKTSQGWFTEDFNYFIVGDNLDEKNKGVNTKTIVFDFTDLDNPVHYFDYYGNTNSIDNNGYLNNNIYYQASHNAGVRMIDISNIESKVFTEVGYFDTYPENDNTETNGAWDVYPFLPSGNIIISDFNKGFFVIRKSNT